MAGRLLIQWLAAASHSPGQIDSTCVAFAVGLWGGKMSTSRPNWLVIVPMMTVVKLLRPLLALAHIQTHSSYPQPEYLCRMMEILMRMLMVVATAFLI
jgi:hypothetical protein